MKDVKQQIKEIAIGLGIEEATAVAVADKCYDDVYWRPWGGATSFKEIDEAEATRMYTYKIDDETSKLRGIVENISNSHDMDPAQKVAAIKATADEYGTRLDSITPEAQKSIWDGLKEFFTGKKAESFDYKSLREKQLEFFKSERTLGNAKVWTDDAGQIRWATLSSNAFVDKEGEIFTTKALEEAVEYADKSGERGPLLVYHVPSAEIGQCDFQAVVGRFLVESGTFNDSPLGVKALEYYMNSDEEQQVSIGYLYRDGDELDGQYDWLRVKERSICPEGKAANPWTSFKVIGEDMNATKIAEMEKVFGKLAPGVIAAAEEKTKELEGKVAFKELDDKVANSLGNIAAMIKSLPEGDVRTQLEADYNNVLAASGAQAAPAPVVTETADKGMDKDKEEEDDEKKEEKKEFAPTAEQWKGLGEMITSLASTVESLQASVKELQKSDDQKMADNFTPRWNGFGQRPSENEQNVITDEAVKALIGQKEEAPGSTNYAAPYLEQIGYKLQAN